MKPLQRITGLILAVILSALMPLSVFAKGFISGGYSDSRVAFAFEDYETVVVYNGDVYDEPDYEEIWPGSYIYVPVYAYEEEGDFHIATDKEIKDNQVTLSYKVLQGEKYVDAITLVDGKKEKINGLEAGTYAKITINTLHTGIGRTELNLKMVLSVKKIAYPLTQVELDASLYNKTVDLRENTVYSAQSPTQYYAINKFNGTPTFDFGGGIEYTAKVSSKSRYYMNLDKTDQPDITRQFPDAYLEYYNFKGDLDAFSSTGSLEIPVTRAKFTVDKEAGATVYAYEIIGNKLHTLRSDIASFDSVKNILTIKTESLGNYVLSSTALTHDIDTEGEQVLYSGYSDSSEETSGTEIVVKESTLTNVNINAANVRANNPLTSDPGLPVLAILPLSISGVVLLILLTTRKTALCE